MPVTIRPRPWSRFIGWIDERVAVPVDNATRRSQKVLVVVVSLFGAVATLFNAQPLFSAGLDAMGWTYVASAVYLTMGAAVILLWPRTFVPVTFLLLMDVLIFPGTAQVLSGGFGSGIQMVPFALLAPLGAALTLGPRAVAAQLVLFIVTVFVIAILEPYSQSIAPEIGVDVLRSFNIPSLVSLGLIAAAASLYLLRQVDLFRAQADEVLSSVLPDSIASRLKSGETAIADRFEDVTVLFADIVGFTPLSSSADPARIVEMLDNLFSDFDTLAAKHGVEKIKTTGDAYMAAAGLPGTIAGHTAAMVEFALDLLEVAAAENGLDDEPIMVRIGIDSGPVVAGVIGRDRYIYDLWGNTVNVASRMESHGVPGMIQVSPNVKERLDSRYAFIDREPIEVKGKGETVTYLLDPVSARTGSRQPSTS